MKELSQVFFFFFLFYVLRETLCSFTDYDVESVFPDRFVHRFAVGVFLSGCLIGKCILIFGKPIIHIKK